MAGGLWRAAGPWGRVGAMQGPRGQGLGWPFATQTRGCAASGMARGRAALPTSARPRGKMHEPWRPQAATGRAVASALGPATTPPPPGLHFPRSRQHFRSGCSGPGSRSQGAAHARPRLPARAPARPRARTPHRPARAWRRARATRLLARASVLVARSRRRARARRRTRAHSRPPSGAHAHWPPLPPAPRRPPARPSPARGPAATAAPGPARARGPAHLRSPGAAAPRSSALLPGGWRRRRQRRLRPWGQGDGRPGRK